MGLNVLFNFLVCLANGRIMISSLCYIREKIENKKTSFIGFCQHSAVWILLDSKYNAEPSKKCKRSVLIKSKRKKTMPKKSAMCLCMSFLNVMYGV